MRQDFISNNSNLIIIGGNLSFRMLIALSLLILGLTFEVLQHHVLNDLVVCRVYVASHTHGCHTGHGLLVLRRNVATLTTLVVVLLTLRLFLLLLLRLFLTA